MTQTAVDLERKPLPAGWMWVNLGDMCDIVIGRTPSRDDPAYWGERHIWVSIADLKGSLVSTSNETLSGRGAEVCGGRLLEKGTLLFSFKLSIGKMAFAGVDLFTNEAIAGLILKPSSAISSSFLMHALEIADYEDSAAHAVKGKTLNKKSLSAIRVPLPPLSEQRRIASILNEQMVAVEKARKAAQERLEAAKALPAAYLREVFEGEKADRWPWVTLGNLITLRRDIVHPKDSPQGTARFVGLQHIRCNTGERIGFDDVEKAELTGRKPVFHKRDIVYGYLRPYLNKVWIADFSGLCSVDQYVYQVNSNKAFPDFVGQFMLSDTYLRRAPIKETPGQLPRIRTEEVAAVNLQLPPLEEQQRIVETLNDKMAGAGLAAKFIKQELDTIEAMPISLLRKAFSGEL